MVCFKLHLEPSESNLTQSYVVSLERRKIKIAFEFAVTSVVLVMAAQAAAQENSPWACWGGRGVCE